MTDVTASVRILPDNWLEPLPVASLFPRQQPLAIDLGCGKGRFLLAHAAANPNVNFIGIDRMLRRIRKIDRKVQRARLTNVQLLRMEAYYATTYLVPENCVTTYYIFFPDPWPKKRHHHNRIFSPPFMDALHRTLVAGGTVQVATDHLEYAAEIEELLAADNRFAPGPVYLPEPDERTDFEAYYIDRGEIGRCAVTRVP